jgi:hypothetical protein
VDVATFAHTAFSVDDSETAEAVIKVRVLPASVLNFNGANGLSYGHPLTARRMADDRRTFHS